MKYKRTLEMTYWPKITASSHSQKVTLTLGANIGCTEYTVLQPLDTYIVQELIRHLRKALRDIRDEELAKLTAAVDYAEGPL